MAEDSGDERVSGDFDRIIEEVGVDYLMALLQSPDDALEELAKNPNLAEILQHLQETEELNTNDGGGEDQGSPCYTEVVPSIVQGTDSKSTILASSAIKTHVLSPTEVIDLECEEIEITSVPEKKPSPVVIIKTEGGVTVCHDGGSDLRPKVSSSINQIDPSLLSSNQLPSIIKIEPNLVSHVKIEKPEEYHREKKKEKEREERKKKEKDEKGREKSAATQKKTNATRHPDFAKYQKRFHLLDTSVTVVRINTIIDVERHMRLKRRRLTRIEEIDRQQQSMINQEAGKIRLVPQPRPAVLAYRPDKSSQKRHGSDTKDKDTKRRKVLVVSDSDSDKLGKGSKASTSKQKHNEKDGHHHRNKAQKPQGEYTSTGTRILPFEKRAHSHSFKEQERIRRPKAEPQEVKSSKDREPNKKDHRHFSVGGSKEGEQKIRNLLQQAALNRQKAANAQFKIPKKETERDRGQAGTSSPLDRIRQQENLRFDRFGQNNSNFRFGKQDARFPPNSYGFHKYNQQLQDRGVEPDDYGGGSVPYDYEADQLQRNQEILRKMESRKYEEEDDDNQIAMHDDNASDDEEEAPPETSPPIDDLRVGPIVLGVSKLLQKETIEYPTLSLNTYDSDPQYTYPEPSIAEVTIQKCAWWFKGIDKSFIVPVLTVPINPEADDVVAISDDGNHSPVSSFGNVSNPGNTACQIYEITSSDQERAMDPDVRDEYCGCSLINAEFRISVDDKFQRILEVRPGSNYDKEKFNARCTICDEQINGKRSLGQHVRSENHRTNFKRISLKIMPNNDRREARREEEIVERVPRDWTKGRPSEKETEEKGKNKGRERDKARNGTSGSKGKGKQKDVKHKHKVKEEVVERVSRSGTGMPINLDGRLPVISTKKKSRSRSPRLRPRSRSPRYRRRSRSRSRERRKSRSPAYNRRRRSPSPARRRSRSNSADRVADFLAKTNRPRRSRSPPRKRRSRSRSPLTSRSTKNPAIFTEKLKLQHAGKWTEALERNWKLMEAEEALLMQEIQDLRRRVGDKPEDHPKYEMEWKAYWELTYQEVEADGRNADAFDYTPGWKSFWLKRVEQLYENEQSDKLDAIRVKHGMDILSLQRILLDIQLPQIPQSQEVVMIPVQAPIPHQEPQVPVKEIYTPFEDDLTARSMSLSGSSHHSLAEEGLRRAVSDHTPVVTIDTVQKTWELLTGQKISGPSIAKSDHSGSTNDGMDLEISLIDVLRLMNGLEDQLSILAPQVKDYFIRADAMDVMESRKSYCLLEDKEFVALLFQCRDKFMGLIRANILTRDVLKRMNKAVYGLNSLLDSDECQRLRPKSLQEPLELEIGSVRNIPETESNDDFEVIRRPPRSHITDIDIIPEENLELNLAEDGYRLLAEIQETMAEVSDESKIEMSRILAYELMNSENYSFNDMELVNYLYEVLEPTINQIRDATMELEALRRSPSPVVSLEQKPEPNIGFGTALPTLPEVRCRAISPPHIEGQLIHQFQSFRRQGSGSRGQNSLESRQSPRSRGSSPFSPSGRGRGITRGSLTSSGSPYTPTGSVHLSRGPSSYSSRSSLGGSPRQGNLGTCRTSTSYTSSPQPQPHPSKSENIETENIPPNQPPDLMKKKGKRTEAIGSPGSWNLIGSSVSSESITGSGILEIEDVKLIRGSRSTLSNGSNNSRNSSRLKLKECPQHPVTSGDVNAEDIVSDPESGEILSDDDILSVISTGSSTRQKLD